MYQVIILHMPWPLSFHDLCKFVHDWIIKMKIRAKNEKKISWCLKSLSIWLFVQQLTGIDVSKYFYLPDLINLTFFKTDYIEIWKKNWLKSASPNSSLTCPRPSGNGIASNPGLLKLTMKKTLKLCLTGSLTITFLLALSHQARVNFEPWYRDVYTTWQGWF